MAADSISVVNVSVYDQRFLGRIEVRGDQRKDGAVGVGPIQRVHGFAGEPEFLEVGGRFEGAVGAFAEEDVFGVGIVPILGARIFIQETKMQKLQHFCFIGKTNIPTTFHEFQESNSALSYFIGRPDGSFGNLELRK